MDNPKKNMKKHIIILLLSSFLHFGSCAYSLKQVVILSRHNVRTPLSKLLHQITPKQWPHWDDKPGDLTAKGALLEGYMGEYFSQWFKEKHLIDESCPNEDLFFAYANNKQRTIGSARAFVNKAFPGCNIAIHHAGGNDADPNFNPVVHNASESFKESVKRQMIEKLSKIDVKIALNALQNILDYNNSKNCKDNGKCDLVNDETIIEDLVDGEEPQLDGPLHIGNGAVDSFKMEYYSGFPMKDTAWGFITRASEWNELMSINIAYHNIRFNTTDLAENIASPLISYIKNVLSNKSEPKIVLLMGHDANLFSVLCSLNFKDYKLKRQFEKVPVGGKLVFQKWLDNHHNRYLLKTEYIYQSSIQLRGAQKLSMESPPQTLTMELHGCPIDDNGFCLWEDFMKILSAF